MYINLTLSLNQYCIDCDVGFKNSTGLPYLIYQ